MDLLTIGRFARLSGLTVRALRHYGALGLLPPARVDEETGYRFFALEQVAVADTIRLLRTLGLPLDEIRSVLLADDPEYVRERLVAHRSRMEGRAAETRQILVDLQRLIERKEPLVPEPTDILYELDIKRFPEQPVLSIRGRVRQDDLKTAIPAAYRELMAYMAELGEQPVPPVTVTVCPFADDDGMVEIENCITVAIPLPGRGRIESRALPACTAACLVHKGPYTELGRSYTALSSWIEEQGLETSGAPREIYVTDPEETPDPADYVTEIAWPIVPDEAKLERIRSGEGEPFTKSLPRA